jgi:hypothetical protein
MRLGQRLLLIMFPYRLLDSRIAKMRELADQYKNINRAYYGEYLSSILCD